MGTPSNSFLLLAEFDHRLLITALPQSSHLICREPGADNSCRDEWHEPNLIPQFADGSRVLRACWSCCCRTLKSASGRMTTERLRRDWCGNGFSAVTPSN